MDDGVVEKRSRGTPQGGPLSPLLANLLDGWMRHRIRALQLKQWRRGPTIYRNLIKMGAAPGLAQKVAANSRRWWRNSWKNLNPILTIKWADHIGMPKLS